MPIRRSWTLGQLLALALALTTVAGRAAAAPTAKLEARHVELFKANCFACHCSEKQEGGVRLDDLPLEISSVAAAERWQKVLNVLNSGEMPPEDEPQPDPQVKLEFLADLSQQMVVARKALADQGGRITMRRLSRREYTNTIQDLLGVEPDVSLLPADGGAEGAVFDTVGSGLFMSGDQVEQYLAAGRRALEDHVVLRANTPGSNVPENRRQSPLTIRFEAEAHPFWNQTLAMQRWAAAIAAEAAKPEYDDLELAVKIREAIRGRQELPYGKELDKAWSSVPKLCSEWETLGKGPTAEEFGFKRPFRDEERYFYGWAKPWNDLLSLPATDRGIYLLLSHPYARVTVPAANPNGQKNAKFPSEPYTLAPGRYLLRIQAGATAVASRSRRFLQVGRTYRPSIDLADEETVLSTHDVVGTVDHPQCIDVPLWIAPGTSTPHLKFWFQERMHDARVPADWTHKADQRPAIWVDWYEFEGPLADPTVEDAVFANTAGLPETEHARAVVERFATRAFRGQSPSKPLLDGLLAVYDQSRRLGEDFETAILEPLSMVLAAPGFLYLAEPSTDTRPRPLTDLELASRLAYCIWAGPPDDALLAVAQAGRLKDRAELDRQVARLLADPRANRGVEGFLFQWLSLHRLDLFTFDWRRNPTFDVKTRAAARQEVYETYADMLRNGRPLGELLKSDSVVINGMLASHYGIDGVTGDGFRRVNLPAGSPRGGLLGMAAIMAMGSNGSVTSPVERGAWVLRKLLADPPPPAPPNVPQISPADMARLKPRERLLAHQQAPQCAACHRKIDPIGFGLENFDVTGVWREGDSLRPDDTRVPTWPIDASGGLHGGPSFRDYFELRDIIAGHERDFARSHTEALVQYALGRPVGFSDGDFVTGIVAEAAKRNFATDAFVHALVHSPQFQSK